LQFNNSLEHEILKSFLKSISLFEYSNKIIQKLVSFLDPRSKSDEFSNVIIKCARKKCLNYYSKIFANNNLDELTQAANKELECYINRPQTSLNRNIDPYKWWQGSKQMLPGLAALAREYLPILAADNKNLANKLNESNEYITTHNNKIADKIAFLKYNM
ncbi:22637_t:CDS:2, partial [Racocetra persica]